MEDFYSGGDALPVSSDGLTPSHLTPRDEEGLFIPGITAAGSEVPVSDPAASTEIVDVDDLYAGVGGDPSVLSKSDDVSDDAGAADVKPTQQAGQTESPHAEGHLLAESQKMQKDVCDDENGSEDEHPPSPRSPALSKDVDWNWPPAFPGRRATASGHLEDYPDEEGEEPLDESEVSLYPPTLYPPIVDDSTPLGPEQALAPSDAVSIEALATETASLSPMDASTSIPVPETTDASAVFDIDLYPGLSGIYDMGSANAFQPVSPSGADFGDLPSSRGDRTYADMRDSVTHPAFDIMNEHVVEAVAGSLGEEQVPQDVVDEIFGSAVDMGDVIEAGELESLEDIQNTKVAEDLNKDDTTPVVEEVEEEVQPPAVGEDIDVVSVSGDVQVSFMDFSVESVEEAVTEGRRTAVSCAFVDRVALLMTYLKELQEPELEFGTAELADQKPIEIFKEVECVEEEDRPIEIAVETTVHVHTDEPTLATFPAPVSADPTVPDPTSVADSPASPSADSEASSVNEPMHPKGVAHAALLPIFKKMESAHSASGLFTPLTDGHSGSVTPEMVQPAVDEQREGEDDDADGEDVSEMVEEVIVETPVLEETPGVEGVKGSEAPGTFNRLH